MKYKVKDVVDSIEYEDLLKLKRDIEGGGVHITKLIDQKIKEQEKQHEKVCSTCSNDIDPYSVNNYTLIFGSEDFKKKATFDGLDCLETFLEKLKQIKKEG